MRRVDRTGLIADGYMYLTTPSLPEEEDSILPLDGGERRPQVSEDQLRAEMRAAWEALRGQLSADQRRERRGPMSARTIERLRALGYAE